MQRLESRITDLIDRSSAYPRRKENITYERSVIRIDGGCIWLLVESSMQPIHLAGKSQSGIDG
jgi:hypothetical protein